MLFSSPHPSLIPQTSESARMLNVFENETLKDPPMQDKDSKEKYIDVAASNFSIHMSSNFLALSVFK